MNYVKPEELRELIQYLKEVPDAHTDHQKCRRQTLSLLETIHDDVTLGGECILEMEGRQC